MKINQLKYSLKQIEKFGEYYKEGHSMKEISQKFSVNYHTLKQYLIKFGYRTPTKTLKKQRCSKITYFDNIDTHEKAYLLGFLYADGYISKTSYGVSIGIALKLEDQYIVEYIKKVWQVSNKIGIYKNSAKLQVTDQHLYKCLRQLGIQENKSIKDFNIPSISKELLNSFILGYFDGDGCITIKKTGYSVVSFCCNSRLFLESIKKILEDNEIKCRPISISKRKNNPLYILYLSKRENQIKFMNFVYKDSPIFLKRKHNKFLQIPR